MESAHPNPGSPSAGPQRQSRANEIGEAILDCLDGVVASRRRCAALYLQGHTVPEIARLLEYPESRVNNLVYRGIADLRRCLEKKGVQP